MVTTLVVFILILGLLVFVHEFGHFWAAKKSGVKVHEFAFGFKPRLFSWKRGETEYAINLIPLGGYVRLEGEQEDTGKDALSAQPALTRVIVLLAGIVMNLVLAWVMLIGAYGLGSYPLTTTFGAHPGVEYNAKVIIGKISENSPATSAGLKEGDEIVAINGQTIPNADAVVNSVNENRDKEISVTYLRNNQKSDTHLTPRAHPPAGEGALGITMGEASTVKVAWYKTPWVALLELGSQIKGSLVGFLGFVSQLVTKQKIGEEVTGIIGVGAATGVVRQLGIGPLMQFIALISTSLAVINSLPLLPLDGGHVLFVILESIRKKPIESMYRQWVAMAGLIGIGILFLVVTYQDILRFSVIERIKNIF